MSLLRAATRAPRTIGFAQREFSALLTPVEEFPRLVWLAICSSLYCIFTGNDDLYRVLSPMYREVDDMEMGKSVALSKTNETKTSSLFVEIW